MREKIFLYLQGNGINNLLLNRGQNRRNFAFNITDMEDRKMVKGIIVVGITLFLFSLYCCLVQGKKEDEALEKMLRKKWENGAGKDEE